MQFFRVVLACVLLFYGCGERKTPDGKQASIPALYNQALNFRYTHPDSLIWSAQQIERLQPVTEQERGMLAICYGAYYNHRSQYLRARQSYDDAIQLLAAADNDTLLGTAYAGIGNSHKNLGAFDEAMQSFLTALQLFEANHHNNAAGVHVNIAQVYQLKGNETEARAHLTIALGELSQRKHDPFYLLAAHTLANLHGMAGNLDSALQIDRACIALCDSLKNDQLKTPFLDNMGLCFMYSDKPDSARFFFLQCLAIDSAHGEVKQVADTYRNLSELALMEKNTALAETYAKTSLHHSRASGFRMGQRSCWEMLATIYSQRDSFHLALNAKDSVLAISRAITNEKTEERIAELQALYDNEKKEKQIAEQQEGLLLQRVVIIAAVIILVLVIALGLLYIVTLRRRKEAELREKMFEQNLSAQAMIYEREQQERARIARDLHDSVGQMLAVTRMRLSTHQHDHPDLKETLQPAADLLEKTIAEVRSISHNLLPEEVALGIAPALAQLRDSINAAGTMRMELAITDESEMTLLSREQVLPIYRIAQEITANMVKHSGATLIRAALTREGEHVRLQISDNGNGFDGDVSSGPGIGWKNIRARAALLQGNVEITSARGQGTTVTITFKR